MAQRNTRQVYTADYFQDPATDKKWSKGHWDWKIAKIINK
jgi:hypothetical protein